MTSTLVHEYTPRGACLDLFGRRDGEVLIAGPAGTGKSRACLEKLNAVMLRNEGARGLIVRKTATSLASSGLVTFRDFVIPELEEAGLISFFGGSTDKPPAYRYTNKSEINIGGMDRESRIMSTDYDIIFAQEATELAVKDWEALSTRLRHGRVSFQQLLADCNPSHEQHWLKRRCDRGQTLMLASRHEDNPLLFDDDGQITPAGAAYIARLDALSGPRLQRLRHGRWSSAEGLVYEAWDPALHLVDWFEPPASWRRIWSVDFGFTNPMVVQCWAEDGDGRLYLYREWYRTGRTVDEFADDILDVVAPGGEWVEPKPQVVVCDHDSDRQGTSMRDILAARLQLRTVPALKDVKVGIQRVTDRLKPADDGRPRLLLMRGALVSPDEELLSRARPTCTEDEIPGYIWDATPGKETKETPVKKDDHGADSARYLVMFVDQGRPTKVKMSRRGVTGKIPSKIG